MKRILTMAIVLCALPAAAVAAQRSGYPETIPLPNNWQPEGIATDGNTFFAGSRATGSIWRGNLKTGRGEPLVTRTDGAALGMKVDERNRLFVAGGGTGTARVYDADDGDLLREYLLSPAPTFVNDVTVTKKAAYFTDSQRQQLYRLPLGAGGVPAAAAQTVPITGDLRYDDDPDTFEVNGITATADGSALFVVQTATGGLFRVDPATGASTRVRLTGGNLANGDGLLLVGRRLYAVQNQRNRIAVIDLSADLSSGTIRRHLRDRDLDVPTTLARKGRDLYAVNARFGTTPRPSTEYDVVRLRVP
jgi:streptogramin lyase